MDSGVTIQPPQTLRGFSQAVITKHIAAWPPDEPTLAEAFVSFFQIEGFGGSSTPEELCRRLGINITVRNLPQGLRGYNFAYQGKCEIVIGTPTGMAAALGTKQHTLFHELREQIEYEFRHLDHPTAVGSELEQRAELFASAVRSLAMVKSCQPIFRGFHTYSGWGKFGLALFALLLVVTNFGYFMLPQWEDYFSDENPGSRAPRRYIRT